MSRLAGWKLGWRGVGQRCLFPYTFGMAVWRRMWGAMCGSLGHLRSLWRGLGQEMWGAAAGARKKIWRAFGLAQPADIDFGLYRTSCAPLHWTTMSSEGCG